MSRIYDYELSKNIILLGYGGSHAYGTNTEDSDVDLRGIFINPLDELLGVSKDTEQICLKTEDTVVYSMKKMFNLLSNCNPNTIEILGLREQDYLVKTSLGEELVKNAHIFLSKKAIYTFGQYAKSQLNRLINKSGKAKEEVIQNETRSLSKAAQAMMERHHKDRIITNISLEGDQIYVDFVAKKISIEDLISIQNELINVHKDYAKSERNDKAVAHNKLAKHMMHLIRLYMMGIDILLKEEIITYREDEHDLLMSIRKGDFLEDDQKTPTKGFEVLLQDYQTRFEEAAKWTSLPDKPDYDAINKLSIKLNTLFYAQKIYN